MLKPGRRRQDETMETATWWNYYVNRGILPVPTRHNEREVRKALRRISWR